MITMNNLLNALRIIRETFFLGLANLLPRFTICDRARSFLLYLCGVKIENPKTVIIWSPVEIRPIGGAPNISIGEHTFINSGVRFAGLKNASIRIGRGVLIGPRVCFEMTNHDLMDRSLKTGSIIIGDKVWIAAGVIITPGIKIGEGSVVASGAVVTKDIEPYTLVGGIPAKKIKNLLPETNTQKIIS